MSVKLRYQPRYVTKQNSLPRSNKHNKPTRRFAPCRLDLVYSRLLVLAHARRATHVLSALAGLCFPTARCERGAVCKAVGRSDIPILIDRCKESVNH